MGIARGLDGRISGSTLLWWWMLLLLVLVLETRVVMTPRADAAIKWRFEAMEREIC